MQSPGHSTTTHVFFTTSPHGLNILLTLSSYALSWVVNSRIMQICLKTVSASYQYKSQKYLNFFRQQAGQDRNQWQFYSAVGCNGYLRNVVLTLHQCIWAWLALDLQNAFCKTSTCRDLKPPGPDSRLFPTRLFLWQHHVSIPEDKEVYQPKETKRAQKKLQNTWPFLFCMLWPFRAPNLYWQSSGQW